MQATAVASWKTTFKRRYQPGQRNIRGRTTDDSSERLRNEGLSIDGQQASPDPAF